MMNDNTNTNEVKEEVKEKKPRFNEERYIDENFIKIPNKLWDNLDITNEELTIFILLQRNYATFRNNISIVSIKMLTDWMYIDNNSNKNIVTDIKKAIISLYEKKYITCLYDIHYNELFVKYKTVKDKEIFDKFFINEIDEETGEIKIDNKTGETLEIDFHMDKNTFFYVELEPPQENDFLLLQDISINKIFEELKGKNLSKYNLIRYYIACCRVTNNSQNFGYLSQTRLKELIHDTRTISRYNKILGDNKLIRYDNDYLTPEKHYCCTMIGRFDDDIENWEYQKQSIIEEKRLVKTDKKISNKKRSVKAKINNTEKELEEKLDKKDEMIKQLQEQLKEYEKLKYVPKESSPINENGENKNDDNSCLDGWLEHEAIEKKKHKGLKTIKDFDKMMAGL